VAKNSRFLRHLTRVAGKCYSAVSPVFQAASIQTSYRNGMADQFIFLSDQLLFLVDRFVFLIGPVNLFIGRAIFLIGPVIFLIGPVGARYWTSCLLIGPVTLFIDELANFRSNRRPPGSYQEVIGIIIGHCCLINCQMLPAYVAPACKVFSVQDINRFNYRRHIGNV
jgi:hypothetical protein